MEKRFEVEITFNLGKKNTYSMDSIVSFSKKCTLVGGQDDVIDELKQHTKEGVRHCETVFESILEKERAEKKKVEQEATL